MQARCREVLRAYIGEGVQVWKAEEKDREEVLNLTCVVGMVRSGHVYLGADSCQLDGWHHVRGPNPKIFRVGGMLIGTAGSQRVSDICQCNLELPEDHWDSPAGYMIAEFLPAVRACLKSHGGLVQKDTEEMSATALVGYRGSLFLIGEDFSMAEIETFEAIGAGAKYALGCLYATDIDDIGAEEAIERALCCAEHWCAACRGPFVVECL